MTANDGVFNTVEYQAAYFHLTVLNFSIIELLDCHETVQNSRVTPTYNRTGITLPACFCKHTVQ
jgi:hypothetical protein